MREYEVDLRNVTTTGPLFAVRPKLTVFQAKYFTAKEFTEKLSLFEQIVRFAGVGAHHHNGNAARKVHPHHHVHCADNDVTLSHPLA